MKNLNKIKEDIIKRLENTREKINITENMSIEESPAMLGIVIPELKTYAPPQNEAMAHIDKLVHTYHALAEMVLEENNAPFIEQIDLLKNNQEKKQKLCEDYVTQTKFFIENLPKKNERDEQRMADLKKIASVLNQITKEHVELMELASSSTDKFIHVIDNNIDKKSQKTTTFYNDRGVIVATQAKQTNFSI